MFITTMQKGFLNILYYDNLYNLQIYCETVHRNCCLTLPDLKLKCHKGQCALNRIEVIMDFPKFFCHFLKFAKLLYHFCMAAAIVLSQMTAILVRIAKEYVLRPVQDG